ncbi:hypothetical protein, partial [Azospirillum formosense]|uniref:hypothetical protein n=1 Tax=Azospirillum formosense TaxID=861533 RepID=UPI001B3BCB79
MAFAMVVMGAGGVAAGRGVGRSAVTAEAATAPRPPPASALARPTGPRTVQGTPPPRGVRADGTRAHGAP